MTFCCILAPIAEASSCNLWDKYRDLQSDNIQTMRDIGHSALKVTYPSYNSCRDSGNFAEEKVKVDSRSSGHNRTYKYINSKRLTA